VIFPTLLGVRIESRPCEWFISLPGWELFLLLLVRHSTPNDSRQGALGIMRGRTEAHVRPGR